MKNTMKRFGIIRNGFNAASEPSVRRRLGIIAMIAVIGFGSISCGGDDDGDDGNWRTKKYTSYTVTDGVAGSPSETVYNWIIYRYKSGTDYEQKYTYTSAAGVSATYHFTRNGQNYNYVSEFNTDTYSSSSTTTYLYDSASGLTLQGNSNGTTTMDGTTTTSNTEYTYDIQLLSDSGGVKTYKSSYKTYTSNGTSLDVSTQGYTEYKIQNGRTLEQKSFTAGGELSSTTTYTETDNAVIRAKLGYYTLSSTTTPTYSQYDTVEVLSDSATELVIRRKSFLNNALSGQTDYTYEKVN